MKFIPIIILLSFSCEYLKGQTQNPDHKKALEKYLSYRQEIIQGQGTTAQDTYEARDDMELKERRKQQRSAWRHQERMRLHSEVAHYYRSYPYWIDHQVFSGLATGSLLLYFMFR